jgi:hypothetical protein
VPVGRRGPNERTVRRVLARLKREDRLGDAGELLAELLRTSAQLVDRVTAPSSPDAGYVRARAITAHGQLIALLRQLVEPGGSDAMGEWLKSLSTPGAGSFPVD